jgi:hemolysin III
LPDEYGQRVARFAKVDAIPGEERANSISHGIGLIAALTGTPILLLAAPERGSVSFLIGTIVFTVTVVASYLASMVYHARPRTRGKSLLQELDHSAIFL